ncbi:MAG: carboxypeptidase-like regulatory domain-containing protein, partial [Candidatus Caldarchaeum sp.]
VNLHQWFSYKIEYRQGDITTSRGLKTYGRVQYIFYQMPPTYYNITVTTTPHLYTGGHGGADWGTPATSKWPGRTDAPVEYEAKILWGSPDASTFSLNDLRNPPLEAWRRASYSSTTGRWSFSGGPDGTWAAYANDRIVLRVFGTIGGRPVTDPDLNPGGVGNQTARICGTRNIDLLTWAHTFYKRVVDGDFDYLNDARRIGNATFNIVNDNNVQMEEYYPATQTFSTDFTSRWTSDLLDTTWLKADSQFSSTIWWNGSYRAENLRFVSYVYPLEFTRGEEPWARFYNKVGLTPPGVLTTEDGPMNAGPDPEVSPNSFLVDRWFNLTTSWAARGTWPRHNFTVVGNEGLWNQQRWRWERAVARGLVPEVPTRPYSLVFEKQVVTFPIPVGFITLNLKDEDLARPIPFAVVDLSIFTRTSNTTSTATLDFSAVYKTGVNGNLTLLYPTQEFLEVKPIDSNRPFVVNYTLTVFWYLNSSIVYKDAFNLTKRGYSVDRVGIADVTFVLAISADKDRPVQDLYARIWWVNVTDGSTTFPGRITVDNARRTWTYTAVPETRGAARWTTGSLTLPWLPASERFTKSDHDLTFDTTARRWTYSSVTRTWDIPYPSNADGVMIPGWPYQPRPTGYYRALTYTQDARIQYRISVWSDQLPIDPTSAAYGRGAWSRAAPAAAAGDHYELVWTRLSTGDDSAPMFRFAWMLFGPSPYDITFYRGPDGVGIFQAIPGYALTRTWERTPTPGSKTVAIKLNATDVQIPVFWQVGDWELGTYDCGPLVGYVVKGQIRPPAGATYGPITIDATTTAGYITVGDKRIDICLVGKPVGLVTYRSGSTVPTVVWGSSWYSAGSRLIVEEVSPPPSIWFDDGTGQAGADNPNRGTTSSYWRNWVSQAIDPVTGQPVRLTVGDQQSIPGVDLGIQYMGYGRPYEGVAREHSVIVFSNDHDNRAHRPFIKMFEFQNVSARITDFNGRALPGAFYQIIDAQTGKSAAWSYAGPDGRIVPMPIRKPGGVFIQRVTYLGQGANGEPTWPVNSFAKWPIAYDSRDDETTQETQKPDIPLGFAYTAEAGPWPTGPGWFPFGNNPSSGPVCDWIDGDHFYDYYDGTWTETAIGDVFDIRSDTDILEWIAACPPAGWGRSFDVITRIFDLRVRFVYGDAQRPVDPAYVFTAPSLALPDQFTIRGQGGIFEAKRLARSTYDIIALWPNAQGEEVGRRTFDVSRVNVGTVEGTVVLALRDVSFTVVDRQGRPVSGARVSVSPNLMRQDDVQLRPDGVFTLLRIPDGRTYDFTVEWTSPFGTTARAAVRESPQGLQNRGSITIPVDDISIKVVDFDDRPVAGADIGFGGQAVGKTDSQGVVIIGQVPLDNTYAVTVTKDGTQIGSDNIRFTSSRTSATLQAGIYDITVLVKGAAGQPIQGALVELVRGGTTIARVATDSSGTAVFGKVVGADYTVRAAYEAFSSSANLARGTRSTTITLDLYTVLLGVPMTFATFLALIIGLILLIIVVVVIVSEYIRWRGRRLGIYPAAPPKK